MGAPGPFSRASLSNATPDVTEWLPLLGSIVQALCGGHDDRPSGDGTSGGGTGAVEDGGGSGTGPGDTSG